MISSNTEFDTEVTLQTSSQPLPDDPPFRILLLGNWSGGRDSELSEIIRSSPVEIDRDNYEDVLAKLNVRTELDLGQDGKESLSLHFKELDDFHPDRLFDQVPMFSDLREIRRRLLNENSFNEAANEARRLFEVVAETESPNVIEGAVEPDVSDENTGGLLDNILSQPLGASSSTKPQTTQSKELSGFLSKIVRSHIVQTDENEQKQLLDLVDEASSGLMRAILHHPRFKELEASWRGIYLLVRKIETDVDLKIYLLDVSKTELSDNLKSVGKLSKSDCYKWLVEDTVGTPGAEPWSLVCGNFTFSSNVDDVAALIRISKICEMANAPFISHVSPMIFGMDSFSEAKGGPDWKVDEDSVEGKLWETLRVSPESGFLGLAMPRYLARLPYGAATDPTESFSFEESKDLSEHENYVWANPSFVCAILLAQTYRKHGWEMIRNFELNISGLPTHIFEDEGETKTKPCAEILMTELICQKILDQGIIPLISYKDSDRIQIGGFQSISFPAKGLSGRWS